MNWLEAEPGLLLNLDQVKALENRGLHTRIYFHMGETPEYADANVPYESLKSLIKYRRESEQGELNTTLKRILAGQTTPVP